MRTAARWDVLWGGLALAFLAGGNGCSDEPAAPRPRLVVVGGTSAGMDSAGLAALAAMAKEAGAEVVRVDAGLPLDEPTLSAAHALALLEPAPAVPRDAGEARALRRFVQSGGALLVFRGALRDDEEHAWFGRLAAAPPFEPAPSPRTFDGGRVGVIDLGPNDAAWSDEAERRRVAENLAFVLGAGPRNLERVLPDDDTFVVETLVDGLRDPIEIAAAPGGDVFVLEREGALKRFDARDERVETIHRFEVASKSGEGGVAQECGGLGLALDPDFTRNGFVYVYRSPREPSVNRLSRFTFDGERLLDERVLLDVATDREHTTCHEGGSLAFGIDGNLFLSTGDNTNPFESDGFAPIDEREDRRFWDAQRSAGDSNDLRGSILRVRPLADGTLAIPPGNLWPPGTEDARPEIFAKGCRNPYRIAVDPRTGAVWWGDVGPDADEDVDGDPMGTDELNRAAEAGFFGWPYVRGGRAYRDRDFRDGARGASFAVGIVNDSPHARGRGTLPPPVAPFLAYPYRLAPALPELGDGGRNAMAGPLLDHGAAANAFPPWFHRVMVFYDWSRARLWLLKLDASDRLESIHPWLSDETWKHPIDLERGPDGTLYLLEYGSTWWDNPDGRLRRIRFGGFDKRPRVTVTPSATSGAAPLAVTFQTAGTVDPEAVERGADPATGLRFRWSFGDGTTGEGPAPTHVFRRPGAYDVEVFATDPAGGKGRWSGRVVAGNAAPVLKIETSAADDTFAWGVPVVVTVTVEDEDEEEIDPERLTVVAEYLRDGVPDEETSPEPLLPGLDPRHLGTRMLAESGCASCHHPKLPSVGPSFETIAARHGEEWRSAERTTRAALVEKVRRGGFGAYGNVPMPAHLHVPVPRIENMVDAIFQAAAPPPVSLEGGRIDVPPRPDDWREAFGVWRIRASYSDVPPEPLLPSLTTTVERVLTAPPVVTPLVSDPLAVTVLEGASARLDGDGAARGESAVEWWSDESTSAVFTVSCEREGTYRIALEWSSADHEAGSDWRLDVAGETFHGTVPGTSGLPGGVSVDAGTVALPPGTHDVRVSIPRVAQRFGGDLRALVFTCEG